MDNQEGSAEINVEAEIDVIASQGITGPTEAELRGEDAPDTETEVGAHKDVNPNEDPKTTEEKPANSEPQVKETPKGFVPLEAVHQARGEIKYLKEQLTAVQEQMRSLQQPKVAEKDVELESFEVLTDEQFEELADDSPAQAAIYIRKLNAYESSQRSKADDEKQQAEFARQYDSIMDTSVAEIEKVAPGIYDEGSTVQKELMEFADTLGFTEDLYYLTNPSTKIILPGESEPLLLGEQAATILSMLVNAKGKMVAPGNTELEAKLRAEITAELMKKFKTPASEGYRGLNQVPKADSETPEINDLSGKVLTTAQLQKLTPAQYEAYLAGN